MLRPTRPMTTHVALLRAINVGGHTPVPMGALRGFLADLGFSDVRSVVQSGNLVFRAESAGGEELERLLEREAPLRLGLQTDFFVRTSEEWAEIIAQNPFPTEATRDPSHLVVMVCEESLASSRVDALRAAVPGPEVIHAAGRHAYITYPNGIGRSRLSGVLIEKTLGTRGTARNWNTVLKLGTLAACR
ncbi:MAG: DUF1697 domain-containing protein [Candidatus Eisenbacteria bacterium]|nr:DUF1697 domain-containing protein [Candidatus Eisenbacteria bacterium]